MPSVNVCASSCHTVEPQLNGRRPSPPASRRRASSRSSRPARRARRDRPCARRSRRDCDRPRCRIGGGGLYAYFVANVVVRLLGEVARGRSTRIADSSFSTMNWKCGRRRRVVVLVRVEQVERVLDPHVVRIALERRLEARASGVDLAEPKLIHAEHAPGVPVLGVERDALPREIRGGACRAARALPARRASRTTRRRADRRERALPQRLEPAWSCVQVLDRRRHGQRALVDRIHLQRAIDVQLRRRRNPRGRATPRREDVRVRRTPDSRSARREAASRRRPGRRPAAVAPRRAARAGRSDSSAALPRTPSALPRSRISAGTARRGGSWPRRSTDRRVVARS